MRGIGLIGRKQSGKSTVGEYLAERFGFAMLAFADPMREMARAINPIVHLAGSDTVRYNDAVDRLGYDQAKETFPEVRGFLQRLGTEAGRNVLGETFWLDQFMLRARKYLGAGWPVVVTDVRFPNEADMLVREGFQLIRVRRPEVEASGDTHPSETALDDYRVEHELWNTGSVLELQTDAEVKLFALRMGASA